MRIIYAVTAGEYEDYGPKALFTDRPDAERAARRWDRSDRRLTLGPADVEEFELYEAGEEGPDFD